MYTQRILAFEQTHPSTCHRVRYEDLVADPEAIATGIFRFLGVDQVPGISRLCFTTRERHPFGPSDHKVWATSEVRTESVGRGARIPAVAVPKPVLDLVNSLHEELGYPLIEREGWNQQMPAANAPGEYSDEPPADDHLPGHASGELDDPVDEIEKMLLARLAGPLVTADGPERSGKPLSLIATAHDGAATLTRRWQLDLSERRISRADADSEPCGWVITADTGTWRTVLNGEANLATVVRHGLLRCDQPPSGRGSSTAEGIRILNDLLLTVPASTTYADASRRAAHTA